MSSPHHSPRSDEPAECTTAAPDDETHSEGMQPTLAMEMASMSIRGPRNVLTLSQSFEASAMDLPVIHALLENSLAQWAVKEDINHIITRINNDGLQKICPAVVFLYAKNVLGHLDIASRLKEVNDLMSGDKNRSRCTRLHRLVDWVTGETIGQISESNQFSRFCERFPAWADSGVSWVLWRDHVALQNKPHAYVERTQLSGLCYMHAPVVMQHYLVAMNNDHHVPMIDMPSFIRKRFSPQGLYDHLWRDEGGSSVEFLRSILATSDVTIDDRTLLDPAWIVTNLEKYGPALVSLFKVHPDFLLDETWTHVGTRPQPQGPPGFHAMLIVGFIKHGNDYRFLLQNWWKEKSFVEVDAAYLSACHARVGFVCTSQHEIPSHFETNPAQHVETAELFDCQERFAFED